MDFFEVGRAATILELRVASLNERLQLWPGREEEPALEHRIAECLYFVDLLFTEYRQLDGGEEAATNRLCSLAQNYFQVLVYFETQLLERESLLLRQEAGEKLDAKAWVGTGPQVSENFHDLSCRDPADGRTMKLPPPSDAWFDQSSSFDVLEEVCELLEQKCETANVEEKEVRALSSCRPDEEARAPRDLTKACWTRTAIALLSDQLACNEYLYLRCTCGKGGWETAI